MPEDRTEFVEIPVAAWDRLNELIESLAAGVKKQRESSAALVASTNRMIGCLIEEGVIGPDDVPLIPVT